MGADVELFRLKPEVDWSTPWQPAGLDDAACEFDTPSLTPVTAVDRSWGRAANGVLSMALLISGEFSVRVEEIDDDEEAA